MKFSTVLAAPLLLVVLASAVPLQDTLSPLTLTLDLDKLEAEVEVQLQDLLQADPSLQDQLDPDRLGDTSEVELTVDQEVLLQVLVQQQQRRQQQQTGEREGEVGDLDHHREARSTSNQPQRFEDNVDDYSDRDNAGFLERINRFFSWDDGRQTFNGTLTRVPHTNTNTNTNRTDFTYGASGNYTNNHADGSRSNVWFTGFFRRSKRSARIGEAAWCNSHGMCRVALSGRHSPRLVAVALAAAAAAAH